MCDLSISFQNLFRIESKTNEINKQNLSHFNSIIYLNQIIIPPLVVAYNYSDKMQLIRSALTDMRKKKTNIHA